MMKGMAKKYGIGLGVLAAMTIVVLFLIPQVGAFLVENSRVWDGEGCSGGGECLASDPLNWDGNVTIATGDNVTFNATTDDVLWDILEAPEYVNMSFGGKVITRIDMNVTEGLYLEQGTFNGTENGTAFNHTFGSITINSGGTYSATSGVTTITSESAGGYAINHDGTFTANSGTVNITTPASTLADIKGTSGNIYNLEISSGNAFRILQTDTVIDNDLAISSGSIFYSESGSAGVPFSVTGDVVISGLLNLKPSLGNVNYSFGSLTINSGGEYRATNGTTTITSETAGGYAVDIDGIYTSNNGLLNVTTATTTQVDLNPTSGTVYNVWLDTSNPISFTSGATISNDLTITSGTFKPTGSAGSMTVTGDVDVTGTLGGNSQSGAMTFGSLTINSGGTYSATSGVTTITSENGNNRPVQFESGGILTPNGGKFNFTLTTSATYFYIRGNQQFYDVEISSTQVYNMDSSSNLNISNDLTISAGTYDSGNRVTTVSGDVDVTGTLDANGDTVDHSFGSLTINSGGTYSATSGTTTLNSGNFNNNNGASGFTHNDGTLNITSTANLNFYADSATFNNINVNNMGGKVLYINEPFTVLGTLNSTGASSYIELQPNNNDITLILGNSTQAGAIYSNTAGRFRVDTHNTNTLTIKGASQLYPATITGADWDWDFVTGSQGVNISFLDFQFDTTTGGNGVTITLDGDAEFDAFTVSAGDTLDLNGQRAEFSGRLYNQGTLTATDSLIFADTIELTATVNGGGASVILTGTSNLLDWAATGTGFDNLVFNGGTQTMKVGGYTPTDPNRIIIASGELDTTSANNWKIGTPNITIANGGTLDAHGSIITITEDWTSSGGLIGASALSLDGSQYVTGTNAFSEQTITVENWFKAPVSVGLGPIFIARDSINDGIGVEMIDGDIYCSVDFSNTIAVGSYNDDKWHHEACTFDGSTLSVYIDGKLENSIALTRAITTTVPIRIGGNSYDDASNFTGEIDEVRIWNRSLSESEIRANMFLQASAISNQTGLVSSWSFDEGTGTTVADSVGSNTGTASDSSVWASGGTFTRGTSTVNMTGDGTIYFLDGFSFYNLEVAQPSKTTTIWAPTNTRNLDIYGLLTTGSGTFTDAGQTQDLLIRGSLSPIDGGSTFANIYRTNYITSTASITGSTYDYLYIYHNDRYLLGNVIVNSDFQVATSGKTVISDGYNITTETLAVTGTLNLTAGSTLTFEDTAGAGFGTSSGVLNTIGVSGNFVTIQSESTSPTNRWIIPGSTLTVNSEAFTDIRDGNNNGDEIFIAGRSLGNNAGLWDFSETDNVTYISPVNVLIDQNATINFDWELNEPEGGIVDAIINWFVNIWDSITTALVASWATPDNTTNFTSTEELPEGQYTWNVTANRSFGNDTVNAASNGTFKVDITAPIINFTTPDAFTNQTFYNNMTLNVSVEDINIYGSNISIFNVSVITNLTNSTIFFDEITNLSANMTWDNLTGPYLPGIYNVSVYGSDDHTKKKIKISNKAIDGGYLYTIKNTETKIYTGASHKNKIINITLTEYDDRISETIYMKDRGVKKIVRYLESDDDIVYRENSIYPAHFVIGNDIGVTWVDFANDDPNSNIKVTKITDKKYAIEITTKKDVITFKSIGGVNINFGSAVFFINNTEPVISNVILSPTSGVYTNNTLSLNATCNDDDELQNITATWNIFKDAVNQTSLAGSQEVTKGANTTLQTISPSLTIRDEVWNATVTCSDGWGGSDSEDSNSVTILNTIPVISSVTFLDSTTNRTNETLTATFNGFDLDSENLTGYFDFYNTTGDIILSTSKTCYNATNCSDTLPSSYTSKNNDYWSGMILGDGTDNSTQTNSSNVTILNTPPTVPNLVYPSNAVIIPDTQLSINFNWNNSSDADGDTIAYSWELSNQSDFSTLIRQEVNQSTSELYYTTENLTSGLTYYWRVNSSDDEVYSDSWSEERYFIFTTLSNQTAGAQISSIDNSQDDILLIIVLVLIASAFLMAYIGLKLDSDHKEMKILLIVVALIITAGTVFVATMLPQIITTQTIEYNIDGSITQTLDMETLDPIINIALGIFTVIIAVAVIVSVYFIVRWFISLFEKFVGIKEKQRRVGDF